MTRKHNEHFTAAYVAQEARKAGRSADFDYSISDGSGRFTSAAEVDTRRPSGQPARAREASELATKAPADGEAPSFAGRAGMQSSLLGFRTFQFDLPMPVSVNAAWRSPSRKEIAAGMEPSQKFLTDDHKQYRSVVIARVHGVMRMAEQRDRPLLGRIFLTVDFFFADRRKCDVDNRIKPLQDALTHAKAYVDDDQIDVIRAERVYRPGRPESCHVTLAEIAQ